MLQQHADENIYLLTNPTRTPGGKEILNPKSEWLMKLRPGKAKVYTLGDSVPVPLKREQAPNGPADMAGFYRGTSWVKGAEWLYGGVGYSGGRCTCWNSRFALDFYARSIAPEPSHFSVAVLDTAGNVMVRIGRPGNVEDGRPLVADHALPAAHGIGGDETALLHACYVAVDTDRRIACVKVDCQTHSKVSLKDVPDQAME
ncbi:MAG: hypothetical protein L6R28_10110 [Planctomycetes bacterium]|nr:hypothetical protein [Planctomycetota bacterium]